MRFVIVALTVLALVFFIIAAAITGHLVTAFGADWLVPGGPAALTLAWLLSLIPATRTVSRTGP